MSEWDKFAVKAGVGVNMPGQKRRQPRLVSWPLAQQLLVGLVLSIVLFVGYNWMILLFLGLVRQSLFSSSLQLKARRSWHYFYDWELLGVGYVFIVPKYYMTKIKVYRAFWKERLAHDNTMNQTNIAKCLSLTLII